MAVSSLKFGQAVQIVKAQDKQKNPVAVTDDVWDQIDNFIQGMYDSTSQPFFLIPERFHKIKGVDAPVLIRDQLPNDFQATELLKSKLIPLSESPFYSFVPQSFKDSKMIRLIVEEVRKSHQKQSLLAGNPLFVTVTPEKPHDPKL